MSNPIRKIRRTILSQVTGSRTFKHRIYPTVEHNPAAHANSRKRLYRQIAEYAKTMRR